MTSTVLPIFHPTTSISSSFSLRYANPIVASGPTINPIPIPIQTRVVIGVSLTSEQVTEHPPQVCNVGLGLKLKTAAISKVLRELTGTPLAQRGDGDGLLLLHDKLILLRGALGLESLPGKTSFEEVHEDVSDGFEIVATGLFHPQVIVDRGVTGGTREGPSLALGDVLEGAGVTVTFRQSEINAVHKVPRTASVRDEVSRLDITMDEMATVHDLNAFQHLIGDHEDGLEAESTAALVELILEGGAEEVHDHEVVRILGAEVVDLGEAGGVLEFSVDLVFVTELGTASAVLFEFDGDLFPVGADTEVDVAEGSATDSFGDAIFRDGGLHFVVVLFSD